MSEFCETTGKRVYPRRRDAAKALAGIRSRRRHVGSLTPYRCNACGTWHLGNPRR